MNYWSFKSRAGKQINKDVKKMINKVCKRCGKPIPIRGNHRNYCSDECYKKRNEVS